MIETLLVAVLYIIIIGLIVWLMLFVIQQIPLGEPFHTVARVIIIAVGCIAVILLLLRILPGIPALP